MKKVEGLLAEGERLAQDFRDIGEVNEHFVNGDQWGAVVLGTSQTVVKQAQWFDADGVPRIFVNHLGNLVATKTALLTKNRPSAVARAFGTNPENVYQAEVANTLIRYFAAELDVASVIQKAARLAVMHGSAGVKFWFDAEQRRAQIAPVSIHQVTIDPAAQTIKEAEWVVFHRWMTVPQARRAFAKTKFKDRRPGVKDYTTSSGIKSSGVECREAWVKPCEEYPAGVYACIVDGVVVEQRDYPLVVMTDGRPEYVLPLVWIKAQDISECIYGGTRTTFCVPLQRSLNEVVSRIMKLIRIESNPHLLGPAEVIEDIDVTSDSKIPFPGNEAGIAAAKEIRFLQGPRVTPEMFQQRDYFKAQMYEVIGLNQVTAGTDNRTFSGAAIEDQVELDEQKNSDTTKSINNAALELYRGLLTLVQLYYDDREKIDLVDANAEVFLFNKADIIGKDLRLEPASELDWMQPVQEGMALERRDQGVATDQDVRKASRDPAYGFSKRFAEALVQQALAGEDIELSPTDAKLPVVLEVVTRHKRMAMLEGRKADFLALADLEAFVRELAADAEEAQPRPTTPPQGGGAAASSPRPTTPTPAPPPGQ